MLICCLRSSREANQTQKLYTKPDSPKPATQPFLFFTTGSFFLVYSMLPLWENSGSSSTSVLSFSSLSFPFSTCSFSWRCSYKEEELNSSGSHAKNWFVTATIPQIMPAECIEYTWLPGCSAENCSCPELQRIWMLVPEEEEIIEVGVIPFRQAWRVTWHSMIPFPWTILPWKVGTTRLLEVLSRDTVIYGASRVAKKKSPTDFFVN